MGSTTRSIMSAFRREVFPSTAGSSAVAHHVHPPTDPAHHTQHRLPGLPFLLREKSAVGGRSCGPRGGEDFLAPLPGMGHSSPPGGGALVWGIGVIPREVWGDPQRRSGGRVGRSGWVFQHLPWPGPQRCCGTDHGVDQVPSRGNTLHFFHILSNTQF